MCPYATLIASDAEAVLQAYMANSPEARHRAFQCALSLASTRCFLPWALRFGDSMIASVARAPDAVTLPASLTATIVWDALCVRETMSITIWSVARGWTVGAYRVVRQLLRQCS